MKYVHIFLVCIKCTCTSLRLIHVSMHMYIPCKFIKCTCTYLNMVDVCMHMYILCICILLCTHVSRKSGGAGAGSQRPPTVRGDGEEGAPPAGGGGPILVSFEGRLSRFCAFSLLFSFFPWQGFFLFHFPVDLSYLSPPVHGQTVHAFAYACMHVCTVCVFRWILSKRNSLNCLQTRRPAGDLKSSSIWAPCTTGARCAYFCL